MKKYEFNKTDNCTLTIMTNETKENAVMIYLPQAAYSGVLITCRSFYFLLCEEMFRDKLVVEDEIKSLNSHIFKFAKKEQQIRDAVHSSSAKALKDANPKDICIPHMIEKKFPKKSHVIHHTIGIWDNIKPSWQRKLLHDAWDGIFENFKFSSCPVKIKALSSIRNFFGIGSSIEDSVARNLPIPSASDIYCALMVFQGDSCNKSDPLQQTEFGDYVAVMNAVRRFAILVIERPDISVDVEEDVAFMEPLRGCFPNAGWSLVIMTSLLMAVHVIMLHRHEDTDMRLSYAADIYGTSDAAKSSKVGSCVAFFLSPDVERMLQPPKHLCMTQKFGKGGSSVLCNHFELSHAAVRSLGMCRNSITHDNTLLSTQMCISPLGLLCEHSSVVREIFDNFIVQLRPMACPNHAFYKDVHMLYWERFGININGISNYNVVFWTIFEYMFSSFYSYDFPKSWKFSQLPELLCYRERQVNIHRFMNGLRNIIERNKKLVFIQFELETTLAMKKAARESAAKSKQQQKKKKASKSKNMLSLLKDGSEEEKQHEESERHDGSSISGCSEDQDQEQQQQQEKEKERENETTDDPSTFIEKDLWKVWNDAFDNCVYEIAEYAEFQWDSPWLKYAMTQ